MSVVQAIRRRALERFGIRGKITLAFSLVFVLLFALQLVIYSLLTDRVVRTMANNYVLETVRQTGGQVDASIDQINMLSKNIVANAEIRDALAVATRLKPGEPLPYPSTLTITSELSKITLAYDGIHSIQLYTPAATINYNFASDFENFESLLSAAEKARLTASRGELVLMSARREYTDKLGRERSYVFSATRKYIDYRTGQSLGYVFINVNERVLKKIIEPVRIGRAGRIRIFSADGQVVSAEDDAEIGRSVEPALLEALASGLRQGFFIEGDQLVVYSVSDRTGWGATTRLKLGEVTSAFDDLRLLNLLIGAIGIAVATLASVLIARALTKPLSELVETMQRIQEGDLGARARVQTGDEIGRLAQAFNRMTDDMRSLITQYYEGELVSRESELKALQAQVSPHFLYNTLDSVYWLMLMRGQGDIADIMVSLCEILRYSIGRDSGPVSLARELTMARHYLMIQRMRFGDKLCFTLPGDAQPRTLGVPKMILQPLIENAIVHGITPEKTVLNVTVEAELEGDLLRLWVIDDGSGIDPERLRDVMRAQDVAEGHTGLGLHAVDKRIRILLGEEYGVEVTSRNGQGTSVRLTLPIIRLSENQEDIV